MKKRYPFLPLLGLLFLCTSVNAQVLFFEDFDNISGPTAGGAGTYVFPSGFSLRNVDNRTPDAQVAYVNEAWERREDFGFSVVDSVAFSTSYYAPAGAADDWMWTPLIGPLPANCVLSWNARTYDPSFRDGYEVRIMTAPTVPTGGTGAIGNQITNSTVVFSTAAENTSWTARSVPLSTYTGQSVYVGFRNNSNDMFLLTIDDIKVEALYNHNARVINMDTLTQYTQMPKTQTTPLAFEADIQNLGMMALSNVKLNAKVYDENNTEVYSAFSNTQPSLAPGAQLHFVVNSWTPPVNAQTYTVKLFYTATETDEVPADDTLSGTAMVSEKIYARDNGDVTGQLGIGSGGGIGYMGQDFEIVNTGRVSSVGIYFTRGYTGRPMAAAIWNMAGGVPDQIVAITDTLIYPDDSADYYVLPIHGGPFALNPGRYAVTAIEFDSTLAVGLTSSLFTPGRTWLWWPTIPGGAWRNIEWFNLPNFNKAMYIRPEILPLCPASLVTASSASDATCGNSNASVNLTVDPGPYTYLWSNGDTSQNLGSVSAGSYSVQITRTDLICTQTLTFNLSNIDGPSLVSIQGDSVACSDAPGTVAVQVTDGTAPYSYLWTNGSTSDTAVAGIGSYSVTVTDANGCILAAGPVDITGPTAITLPASVTPAGCFGGEGSASVQAQGGTPPYSYQWNNGANTATATGPAGPYTVTVTDSSGCSAVSGTLTVTEPAPLTTVTGFTPELCQGCANGTATVTVSGGTAPYTYSWSPSGGTGATATGLTGGTYTVTVTDAHGCETTATLTVLTSNASIPENGSGTDGILAFPNPSQGVFYITANIEYSGEALVEIVDITGKVLYAKNVLMNNTLTQTSIHLEYSVPGTYILRFTADKKQFFRKLVIE